MSIRKTIFNTLQAFNLSSALQFTHAKKKRIPVLLFHRINPTYDIFTEPLSPLLFESIIQKVKEKYEFTSLRDAVTLSPTQLKNKIVITFDDATQDFYQYAFPILKKHQIPVTLFVPTNYVENGATWNNQIFSIFNSLPENRPSHIKVKNLQLSLKKENLRNSAYQVIQQLESLDFSEITKAIDELKKQVNTADNKTFAPTMSWKELQDLVEQGIEIGSHSHYHTFLSSQSKENLVNELSKSKSLLEEKLNIKCDLLAYPVGNYNEEVIKEAKKHYSYAFRVGDRQVDLTNLSGNRFEIPRIDIHDKSVSEVLFRINEFHQLIKLRGEK